MERRGAEQRAAESRLDHSLKRNVVDSVHRVLLQPTDRVPDSGVFVSLKTGLLQASSGMDERSLLDFLDELEPKPPVLTFLAAVHKHRSIARKQVAAVVAILMNAESWRSTLHRDQEACAVLLGGAAAAAAVRPEA
ncbi:unnamed protein product, partial [Prorocentrum cordatum]